MSEFLIIRLGTAPAEPVSWVTSDQTGAILGPTTQGPLHEAAPFATGRQVIGLLPATDVLRTTATVPVKGTARILQALPFALEDQLADDVETLHFAAGGRGADDRYGVAIIRRDLMDAWLQLFATAGVNPDKLYAESDAIAGVPNTSTLLVEDDQALLAHADGGAAVVDTEGLEMLLELWLAAPPAGGDEPLPRHLVVFCSPSAAARHATLWERLRPQVATLDIRSLSEGPLPRLAAQIVTAPGVNLLQGEYAHRSSLAAYWPAWRATAACLLALGLLFLAAQVAELVQLRRQSAALEKNIGQAFAYTFPGTPAPKDVRTELASRLRTLGGSADVARSREFLDALRSVAQALTAAGSAHIEAVSYRGGVMELRLRAPSVDVLDRIQKLIGESGSLHAEIQSANASGTEVQGRLQIKRSGG